MQALEALNTRRSVRNFDPSFVIPKEDLDKIVADGNLRTYYKRLIERAV